MNMPLKKIRKAIEEARASGSPTIWDARKFLASANRRADKLKAKKPYSEK